MLYVEKFRLRSEFGVLWVRSQVVDVHVQKNFGQMKVSRLLYNYIALKSYKPMIIPFYIACMNIGFINMKLRSWRRGSVTRCKYVKSSVGGILVTVQKGRN
jgi:hypothetical protein